MDVMPVVDLGRQPAKATVGEPFPVSATVFREGHDKLGAEVVLTDPDGVRRPPVRMAKHAEHARPLRRLGHPGRRGRLDVRGPGLVATRSPPGSTTPGIKIPAGVDVELMFTEGRLLLERVAAGARPADKRGREVARRRDRAPRPTPSRPAEARLAALQDPELAELLDRHPLRELRHRRGPLPARTPTGSARSSAAGTSSSRAPRARPRTRRPARSPAAPSAPPPSGSTRVADDGLRRHLPAADPPDRRGQPQGPEQHPDARPGRHRLAVGDRQQGRRPRRHPPRPRHVRGLRRVRRPGRRARPRGRARPRPPGGARPPVGRRRTRSGSPPAPTAPSPTPRTRRRSTRTSTRSTSTTTRPASAARCCGSSGTGWRTASGSSASTTRTPSRSRSGSGCSRRSARTDPDVIFLSEAFTRPAMMRGARRGRLPPVLHLLHLAHRAAGRSRSTSSELSHETDHLMRPNFFVNTPDILHAYLQYGGPAAFKIRAALAATSARRAGACTPATSCSSTSR